MSDFLLYSGTLITMNPEREVIEDGAVAIKGSRIVDIGDSGELRQKHAGAEQIDCKGKLILPGFIDAHSHAGHCMMKAIAYDTARSYWMPIMTDAYHHNTTDEFWYLEGKLAALERLKFGVTCGVSVISNAQRCDTPEIPLNHAKGYAEVGVREVLAIGPSNPPFPRSFSRVAGNDKLRAEYTFDQLMEVADETIRLANHSCDDLIRAFVAPFVMVTSINPSNPTPPDMCSKLSAHDKHMARRVREIARKHNTRIHTEAFGGMIYLAAQDENALLGPDVHVQHCTGISFDEAMILARTQTNVTTSPNPEQFLYNRCPIPELLELGVNVAITTDGTSPAVSFDMLTAARKTQLVQQGLTRDRHLMPLGKLLEMITIGAAKAIGWEDELGSLEVGKKADVITVNMMQPHITPAFMPVHKLMLYACGNDVADVIINGRLLMRDRVVESVIEADVIRQASEESDRTIERAGLRKYMERCDTFWSGTRMYNQRNRFEGD